MFTRKKLSLGICATLLLSGCSSFGYGVAEAILDQQKQSDDRLCQITGQAFTGLEPFLNDGLKVLMVHGIGQHGAGYSAEFLGKLSAEMGLIKKSPGFKTIDLTDPLDTSKNLGSVRVHHYFDEQANKSLLFYELVWSIITEEAKKVIAYDSTGEYSHRRATINNLLKNFSNDTLPDSFLYLGDHREDILISFTQAYCWMVAKNWSGLAPHTTSTCDFNAPDFNTNLENNHYAFVSHSLGSRITIDGLQRIARLTGSNTDTYRGPIKKPRTAVQILKQKNTPIFMLANQLPVLQLGRKKAEVTQQYKDYCLEGGKYYPERMYKSTEIIAFNDPNDIASYPIPYNFSEQFLDSRLCINTSNVDINIANVVDLLGLGTAANPLTAHSGYQSDNRVIALIAKGIGSKNTADIINTRCKWIEETD